MNNNEAEHPDSAYVAISLNLTKQEVEYLKDDLKDWEITKKLKSEGINIVHVIISMLINRS